MADFYAHSRQSIQGNNWWQQLEKHLWQTAELAQKFAGSWRAADWGYYAGLWHDIEKNEGFFQHRLLSLESDTDNCYPYWG